MPINSINKNTRIKEGDKYQRVLLSSFNAIYFTLPKNACTSLKIRFAEALKLPKRNDFPNHIHKRAYYPFTNVSKEDIQTKYQDYIRFSIVRNPWSRLVSCYKDKLFYTNKENAYFIETNPGFYWKMPFDEFIETVVSTPDYLADFHFCSQLYLLHDIEGDFLLNYVGEFDNMKKHLLEIKTKTDLPLDSLTRQNSTEKYNYTEYYTPDLNQKVRERFKLDIDFFNYEFGEINETFPFGYINDDTRKQINSPLLRNQILEEKTKELMAIIKQKNNEIKDLRITQKNYQNSFSWKITTPFRKIASWFIKREESTNSTLQNKE